MRLARLPLLALGLLVGLLVAPSAVFAADPVTVTGSVVRDGAPVAGVSLTISVAGSDIAVSTATDDNGAFSADIEAGVGDTVTFSATGDTSQSNPDADGCFTTETPIGKLVVTLDAVPPAPFEVALDTVRSNTVCTETGRPDVTPPATDVASSPATPAGPGSGLLLALAVLGLTAGLSISFRRRSA